MDPVSTDAVHIPRPLVVLPPIPAHDGGYLLVRPRVAGSPRPVPRREAW